MNPRDDDEHDAWLREALRHAPDAHIGAPPTLSDTILREARAATAKAAPAPARRGALQTVAEFWTWLTRPAIATGFASVMAATLVGMLWWGRPMDEAAMPAPPAPVAAQPPAPAPAAVPLVVEVAAAPPPQVVKPDLVAGQPPAAPRAKAAAPVRREDKRAAVVSAPDAKLRDSPPPPSPAPEQRATVQGEAMASVKREAAPASPAPTAAAEVAAQPLAAARVEAEVRADTAAPAAKAAPRAAGAARLRTAPAASALADRVGDAALRELRAAVRAEPDRWRWQRGEGSAQAMTPTLQAWLAQLDDDLPAPTSGHTAPAAPTLRLLRDGLPHTSLALGRDSLRLTPADAAQPALQWPLSPAAAAALGAALDTATR